MTNDEGLNDEKNDEATNDERESMADTAYRVEGGLIEDEDEGRRTRD